jgi:hypothetical protein
LNIFLFYVTLKNEFYESFIGGSGSNYLSLSRYATNDGIVDSFFLNTDKSFCHGLNW